ncbi:acyl-CoA dehydrogenase family protein [Pseudomonas huaxiensis]|uniref:acyl-CoA dehydrogenase family protein n=1 Tax=Pseudomonas huaxiensis TaxID=2213017 RepID=UPI000DA6BCF1|nr:acyl-CoA dehydrogenase family protein [Pseudomonas huaxiensis]
MTRSSDPRQPLPLRSHQPYPSDWIALARELGIAFRKGAAERDQQATPPVEQIRQLRESGLVNLFYPAHLGGGGGSVRDAAWSVLEVARGDGSIGALLAFHFYNSAVPLFHDYSDGNAEIVRRATDNRWYWGNVTQYVNREFFATPHADGGYVLNGVKKWNTGAPLAEITTVLAEHADRTHFIYGYLPTDREGIRFEQDWNPIGLRGADSSTVIFDNVRLHADEVIPWKHQGAQRSVLPFWTTFGAVYYSAVYLGSALAALDTARDYARNDRRQTLSPGASSLADDPLVLTQFGELWSRVQAGLGYFDRVIAELQEGWDKRLELDDDAVGRLTARALALRSHSSALALEITPRLFDFPGGRGTQRDKAFDRFWRDARTLSSHDPLINSLHAVGNYALNNTPLRYGSRFPTEGERP